MTEADETLVWAIRPADRMGGREKVVYAAALLVLLFGVFVLRQAIVGILGAMMLLGFTADLWLGSRFTLDEKGASAKTGLSVTAMEWPQVKRILLKGPEVRLSPLERATKFLDTTRGVGLTTTEENRERVLDFVRRHVAPNTPEEAFV